MRGFYRSLVFAAVVLAWLPKVVAAAPTKEALSEPAARAFVSPPATSELANAHIPPAAQGLSGSSNLYVLLVFMLLAVGRTALRND